MPPHRKPPEPGNQPAGRLRPPTVRDRLIELITDLDLDSGEALPAETELMRTLGVSRNSVREALKSLQAHGIVDVRHGYGTYVGTAQLRAMRPGLLFRTRLAVRRGDPGPLRDVLEARALLEAGLIRRCALELTPADLDRAEAELDALAAADDPADRAAHDRRFHELLYEPLGNAVVLQLVALFWDVHRESSPAAAPADGHEHAVHRHRRIVEALRARDPDAAAAAIGDHFADLTSRTDRWAAAAGALRQR